MFRAPATWPIWREPRIAIGLILVVELSALLVPALSWGPITSANIEVSFALASLSIAYSTFTCRTERARSALHGGADTVKYQNLLACWGFAAAVILPLPLMWVVAVVAAIAEWPVRNIAGRVRLYRHAYSSAAAILAATAAHAVTALSLPPWYGIAVAVPTYMAVGIVAVMAVMVAARQPPGARSVLEPSTHRVEFCTLAIALGIVLLISHHCGILVWLSLPAAIGLQRVTTRNRLRQVTDEAHLKPMSTEAWFIAAREVVAALPVVSIMRIDTAEPAAVNAVAQFQIGCDAIGYLGAGGLGLLLVDCPAMSAEALASRLRMALREKGIEGSVAAAGKPRDGYSLDHLLTLCEAELVARDAASRSAKPRPEA